MSDIATSQPDGDAGRKKGRRISISFATGIVILIVSLILAFFPSAFAPYDPNVFDYNAILQAPSSAHLFGTDNFGRDMFSRVIHAYTLDMQIAVFATIVPAIVGTLIGAFVGYVGGITESVFGRIVDATITFPFLVLVIAIVSVLGPGLINMYIAVGIIDWVFYGRLTLGEIKVQKRLDYAAAGQVMGYRPSRIIFRHLLPNSMTPALVYWMTDMALCILLGSSLGYLGLGAQPPAAEWGVLIADGKNFMTSAWWISVFPGIAIVITGLGFSLLGDGITELLRTK
ncbi:peptide/nickel transport system permease protein [Breoghania corrubedonensis]|uniref:Peptide/nickel transport system permease protein n=1 Tax=Breoghania corrubedonensis TaxID=665038 RepID=A0A2T5VC78_9HYPH|nr:ABC transporter permease [Breoghania corrubedonensis]PTW61355.1 peptide/nickel transport system permease protein [Breoghania corrubedonensis]